MPTKLRYHIVGEESPEFFVSEIHDRLDQGYKLHGGMAVDNGTFYQAVIKNEMAGGRRTRKAGKARKGRKAGKSRKSRK